MMTERTGQGQADKKATEERTAQVAEENRQDEPEPTTAAEKVEKADDADIDALVNPYPEYGGQSLDDLRKAASRRGVEINRDVERAHLVALLRAADPTPVWDLMPLETLRERAGDKKITMEQEFETAQLVSELRAADTHTR